MQDVHTLLFKILQHNNVLPPVHECTGHAAIQALFREQEALKDMVHDSGFSECKFYNLVNGVVAIHKAK